MCLIPDLAWVHVYSYLALPDRNRLSQTCKLLHLHFHDPLLWKKGKVVLHFLGNHRLGNIQMFHRIEKSKKMFFSFGKYIRNLSITLKGRLETSDELLLTLLKVITEQCSAVETLTLNVGKWNSLGQPVVSSNLNELLKTLNILTTSCSQKLRRFYLLAWPLGEQGLKSSHVFANLTHMSMFHPRVELNSWVQMNAIIPQSFQVQETLQNIPHLTSLSLHCSSINQSFLQFLSSPSISSSSASSAPSLSSPTPFHHLQHFHILLLSDDTTSNFYQIPTESWRHLFLIHPSLLLHVTIGNTIPEPLLSSFLHPSITPSIRSITISKYARYSAQMLSHINFSINFTNKNNNNNNNNNNVYSTTNYTNNKNHTSSQSTATLKNSNLHSFSDYSDTSSDFIQLMSFVISFPSLDRLSYNGSLYDTEVIAMVMMRKWKRFIINMDKILINYSAYEEDKDNPRLPDNSCTLSHLSSKAIAEDAVLFKDNDGENRLTSMHDANKGFYTTIESDRLRKEAIARMMEVVENHLTCPWLPFRRQALESLAL